MLKADNVEFDVDSAQLTESAMLTLADVSMLLLQTPEIKFEIQGHTNNAGSRLLNQRLSQLRADAVRNFILEAGVETVRLNTIGYGETMPRVSNDTVEGRKLNRRVEFKVVNVPVCQ